MKHYPPQFEAASFHCPFCGVYANQNWAELIKDTKLGYQRTGYLKVAECGHCDQLTVWSGMKMIQPSTGNAPLPNTDLPDDILSDYLEANSIMIASPRGAAALLRLAIQKLCRHLGGDGKNINNDISKLVEAGLPVRIQQALDIVRVVGNHAVHPGQLDLNDSPEIVNNLFNLINYIVDSQITQPNQINAIFNDLPEDQREAILKRDSKANKV